MTDDLIVITQVKNFYNIEDLNNFLSENYCDTVVDIKTILVGKDLSYLLIYRCLKNIKNK